MSDLPLAPWRPLPTWRERQALGTRLRDRIGRTAQAIWHPAEGHADLGAFLLRANRGRQPDLLPIKFERMAASPFAFFRGAAPLMAADLAGTQNTGVMVQLCGDAHVVNLGAYAAPDGHLVFDLNDFDETILGPWEWDIKRLAASIVLAGRDAGNDDQDCRDAVQTAVRSYRESIRRFSKMKVVELLRFDVRHFGKGSPVATVMRKAERVDASRVLKKLTVAAGHGLWRFHDRPPVLRHVSDRAARAVLASLTAYRDTLRADHQLALDAYHPVDVAFKVVGTGSVGTRDYVVLLLGNGPSDALFLQVKQALASCYAPFLPQAPVFPQQGRRVAEAQYRLQTVTDPFIGWTAIGRDDFLVRQLADHKAAIEPGDLEGRALAEYGVVAAELLAKAHARSGDAAAIAGYCGGSDKLDLAVAGFALSYANQTAQDHALFAKAFRSWKLTAHASRWPARASRRPTPARRGLRGRSTVFPKRTLRPPHDRRLKSAVP